MWNLKSDERLAAWKEFRSLIGSLPFEEAVNKTVHLWSYAPFVNHYLDKRPATDWPTPWELLADGKFDDMAKALGMLYTLALSEHGKQHEFLLETVTCSSSVENYNLVMIDRGKYILNYIFDDVISKKQLDKEANVVQVYTPEDLKLSKY